MQVVNPQLRFEASAAALFVLIASALVLIAPSAGIGNNGDFQRLMFQLHVDYPPASPDRDPGYVHFAFLLNGKTPRRPRFSTASLTCRRPCRFGWRSPLIAVFHQTGLICDGRGSFKS